MKRMPLTVLSQHYRQAVDAYLGGAGETVLARAYDLGRAALSDGLGVLDLVLLHHATLAEIVVEQPAPAAAVEGARAVLVEALSPFEVARREFKDGNEALRRLNETLEDEARRIAHSLHDNAGALLATVNLVVDELRRDHPECAAPVARLHQLLGGLEAQLRRMSHELCPTVLDDLGLIPAFEFLAAGVRARSQIEVTVDGSTEGRLPPAVELALYRTVQEALTNVVRHAGAHSARVVVKRAPGAIVCTVSDDGHGLPGARSPSAGIGLIGIRERLTSIGGVLRVGKNAAGGTFLEATAPLVEDA